jgi:shikimate kinase
MATASDARTDAPVFLVGFMASGKTTVGRLVAARLGWDFRDLDQIIVDAAGRSVAEIFADPHEGEPGFRRREADAVRVAGALRHTVVATGGGAACREENLVAMLTAGRVIGLFVTADEVVRRTAGDKTRPLLAGSTDPAAAAGALLAERAAFYARAHAQIDTTGKSADAVAAEVVRLLEAQTP